MKTDTYNSILESFQQFGQISSKPILIISSYTVSNSVRFLRRGVNTAVGRCCTDYRSHRSCLKQANAGADCIGAYPAVLMLSAWYWQLDTQSPSTATSLAGVIHHAYSRHLYVLHYHTPHGLRSAAKPHFERCMATSLLSLLSFFLLFLYFTFPFPFSPFSFPWSLTPLVELEVWGAL